MNTKSLVLATAAVGLSVAAGLSMPSAEAQAQSASINNPFPRGPGPLRGTKCWELAPKLGKSVFVEMSFLPIRQTGRAMMSGSAVRMDGGSPDRVLQFTGSGTRHRLLGSDGSRINRLLIDAHYSMTKTGTDPADAFVELGRTLAGHYSIRLDSETLNGAFEGHDLIHDWTPPLSGPSATHAADAAVNPFLPVAGANNFLGSVTCDGSIPGFDNCGTILPVNNAGTMTLIGSDVASCTAATPTS